LNFKAILYFGPTLLQCKRDFKVILDLHYSVKNSTREEGGKGREGEGRGREREGKEREGKQEREGKREKKGMKGKREKQEKERGEGGKEGRRGGGDGGDGGEGKERGKGGKKKNGEKRRRVDVCAASALLPPVPPHSTPFHPTSDGSW
jgi:hypothetical protein